METAEIFKEATQLASLLTEDDIREELDALDDFICKNGTSGIICDFKLITYPELNFSYSPSKLLLFILLFLHKKYQTEVKCLTLFIKIIDAKLLSSHKYSDPALFRETAMFVFHDQFTLLTKI